VRFVSLCQIRSYENLKWVKKENGGFDSRHLQKKNSIATKIFIENKFIKTPQMRESKRSAPAKKFKAKALLEKNPAQDAPGSA